MLFCFWYVALSYLAFPRIIFAWGMDRMGPKWFTSINPRWASPVKNYILCFVLCQAAIALYSFWLGSYMQGLTVTGMEIVSVWGVTTIAAIIFPYVKRSKGIWESSPYRTWKFLGIPLVGWGAAGLPRLPGHPLLLPHLHGGDEGLQRPVLDPLRHRLGHRHRLVLLLGRPQQGASASTSA